MTDSYFPAARKAALIPIFLMKLLNRIALGATIGSVAAAGGYRWYQNRLDQRLPERKHAPRKTAKRKTSHAHHDKTAAAHSHQPTNAAVAA